MIIRKGYLMGKRFNSDEMQKVFEILQESYDVYGPRIYQGTGCFSDTDVIRYGRTHCRYYCCDLYLCFIYISV